MSTDEIALAYSRRAAEYIELFGSIDATDEIDRDFVLTWSRSVTGPILDVGCGPGQWTRFLHDDGASVEGIDPVPRFVEEARRRHPGVGFRVGRAEALDVETGGLGGILAWYSLIHIRPDDLDDVISEFARCIAPGGRLAVGYFAGPVLSPFDHAVKTAYFWPTELLTARLEKTGFTVVEGNTRDEGGARPLGIVVANRRRG